MHECMNVYRCVCVRKRKKETCLCSYVWMKLKNKKNIDATVYVKASVHWVFTKLAFRLKLCWPELSSFVCFNILFRF